MDRNQKLETAPRKHREGEVGWRLCPKRREGGGKQRGEREREGSTSINSIITDTP